MIDLRAIMKPRPLPPGTPSTAHLAALPIGPGFEPDARLWVEHALDATRLALPTAGPHSTLPATMTALVHAYFAYRARPSAEGLDRILDTCRELTFSRILSDVQGTG